MNKYRIAILLHENDTEYTLHFSLVRFFADYWIEDGHEVIYLFGTKEFIPADIIFVHVDLSVVPDSYLEFAQRYPVTINGNVKDVRKSTYSHGLLTPDDDWNGPVIVKSDKNCGGAPERARNGLAGRVHKKILKTINRFDLKSLTPSINSSRDYCVFGHLSDVPRLYFYQPGLIIQKFIPEMDGELYVIRAMSFLGNRHSTMCMKGKNPIVEGDTAEIVDYSVESHPDILKLRNELKFDYGKFDYVVVNGETILLDANKTIGCSQNLLQNHELEELRRYRAEGLYSFLPDSVVHPIHIPNGGMNR